MKDVNVSELIDRVPVSRFQILCGVLCALVAILDGFDTQAIAFVAPLIARHWALEASALGPIFGAGLLGLTVGALAFGPVADRIGRRPVIILSTAVFGVFSLVTAFAYDFTSLFACRLLTGIGLGGAMPNIIALTAEYSPARHRATLVTVMFCGFPLGAVLGGLASARLLAVFDWPSVFYLGGILPLLLLPVLLAWLPESIRFLIARGAASATIAGIVARIDPSGAYREADRFLLTENRLPGLPMRHLFADGRALGTILLWIVFFSNLLVLYFLINWLPSVLQKTGLPIEKAIIGTVLLNAGGIVGGILLGRVVDRLGPFRVLSLAYAAAALAIAGLGIAGESVAVVMAVIAAAGFLVIGTQFCMNALAAGFYPTAVRSTGVGWALGIGRIGSILGPVVGGIIISGGWDTADVFLACAVPALIAAVCVYLIGMRATPRPQAAAQAV